MFLVFLHLFLGNHRNTYCFSSQVTFILVLCLSLLSVGSFSGYPEVCAGWVQGALGSAMVSVRVQGNTQDGHGRAPAGGRV